MPVFVPGEAALPIGEWSSTAAESVLDTYPAAVLDADRIVAIREHEAKNQRVVITGTGGTRTQFNFTATKKDESKPFAGQLRHTSSGTGEGPATDGSSASRGGPWATTPDVSILYVRSQTCGHMTRDSYPDAGRLPPSTVTAIKSHEAAGYKVTVGFVGTSIKLMYLPEKP